MIPLFVLQDIKSWSLADKDTIKGIEPMEDALLCRFRPEVLGRTFGGQVGTAILELSLYVIDRARVIYSVPRNPG